MGHRLSHVLTYPKISHSGTILLDEGTISYKSTLSFYGLSSYIEKATVILELLRIRGFCHNNIAPYLIVLMSYRVVHAFKGFLMKLSIILL